MVEPVSFLKRKKAREENLSSLLIFEDFFSYRRKEMPDFENRLNYIKEYSDKMKDSPCKYEKMPYHMVMSETSPYVEQSPHRICESARDEKDDAARGQGSCQGVPRDNNHPPHKYINQCGEHYEFLNEKYFEYDTHYSSSPDDAEKGPTELTAKCYKKDGGVRSCYEKVNGSMVENFEQIFDFPLREAVYESGRQEQEKHCSSINSRGRNRPYVTVET